MNRPHIVIVSSSLDPNSKSAVIARRCLEKLERQDVPTTFIDLRETQLPRFDNNMVYETPEYADMHAKIVASDGFLLCTPVYNWSVSAELKRLIEATGSTPPDGSRRGAWFDKVVTFAGAAGLPHSTMAFGLLAQSLTLDFRCVINPYQLYLHDRHWTETGLSGEAEARVDRTLEVMLELTTLLAARTYRSSWEV